MKKIILLTLCFISMNVVAHGDHSTPGELPLSPNGGVLAELKHGSGHSHKGHNHAHDHEDKFFVEGVMKNKTNVALYFHKLDHDKFKTLKAKNYKIESIKLTLPRSKKTLDLKVVKGDELSSSIIIPASKDRRIIVEGVFVIKGHSDNHSFKVQLEKKR